MKYIYFITLLVINILPLKAQDKVIMPREVSEIQQKLDTYYADHPSGRLFLHLDKSFYTPEETIWFKAYLLGDKSL